MDAAGADAAAADAAAAAAAADMSDVDEAAGGTFGKPPDLPCF